MKSLRWSRPRLKRSDGRTSEVIDTVPQVETGDQLHVLADGAALPQVGEELRAINWCRR